MAKKRSVKVYGQSGYKYRETPTIMLKGLWLKEAGFDIGDYISVTCEDGKIIITQDAERAAVKAAEAEFMEREMKACCGGPEEGCSEGGQDRKAADRKHGSEEDGKVFQELGGEEDQGNVGFHPDRGAFQAVPADTSFGVWPCEARRWKNKGVSSHRAGGAGGYRAADKGYRA